MAGDAGEVEEHSPFIRGLRVEHLLHFVNRM